MTSGLVAPRAAGGGALSLPAASLRDNFFRATLPRPHFAVRERRLQISASPAAPHMQMKRRNRQRDRFGPGARVIKVDLLPVKWQSARHLDTARLVPREETCARFFFFYPSLSSLYFSSGI